MENTRLSKVVFYLMVLCVSLIGFFKGVLAESGGKDAQWYPANLFSKDIDFYSFFLENFNDWFMRSVPNYYYQLYYLLYPISSVSWESFKLIWFLGNITLLLFFLFQVKKDFNFDYKKMGIIFLPFFIGFPLILLFTNGQSTVLILVLAYLAWKHRDNKWLLPIFLSLLTLKYSFGVPIVFGFLLMGYYRSVLFGGLITLLFPLMYSIQFNLNFVSAIFLPFKVSTSPTTRPLGSGPGDLMSLYGQFFDGPLLGINVLTISLLLFIGLFAFLAIRYRLDKKTIFIGSLLFSLFGFYHFGHDYVLFILIVPFMFNLRFFKWMYGYLLIFCLMPRIIRVWDFVFESEIGVKPFMMNKYFVMFNVSVLIIYFFVIIRDDIISKKRGVKRRYINFKDFKSQSQENLLMNVDS